MVAAVGVAEKDGAGSGVNASSRLGGRLASLVRLPD